MTAAMDKLIAARNAARDRALASPAVADAIAAAQKAKEQLDTLRQSSAPGSADLTDANITWMHAVDDAAVKLRDAIDSDDQVIAARQAYNAAYEEQLRTVQSAPSHPAAPATPPGTSPTNPLH